MPGWLTTLLPTIAGLAGVVLGVWMTQRGAKEVAEQTIAGQLMVARDAALREWRKQQIAPYLEAAKQRTTLWIELQEAAQNYDSYVSSGGIHGGGEDVIEDSKEEYEKIGSELQKAVRALTDKLKDYHFQSLVLTKDAIPDSAFRKAVKLFVEAEKAANQAYYGHDSYLMLDELSPALAALNEAAEHYIFAPPSPDKS